MTITRRITRSDHDTCPVVDATQLTEKEDLQQGTFTKAFSNAALHWILCNEATRDKVFQGVAASLCPGGTFAFEMGGLGNVTEMRTALLMVVSRRIGMDAALAADPWFFPDEEWATAALERAGFRVERAEREWRPTRADKGGVEGWVRLFGSMFLEALPEEQREEAVAEAVGVLKEVCRNPSGGEMLSYVRLRCLATKL
jgi:trans-aconitate methyltransferase